MTPPVHGRWRLPAGSTYMKHNIPDTDNIVMNTTTSKAELYTLLMDAKVLWHGEGKETLLNSGPVPRPPTRLHSRTTTTRAAKGRPWPQIRWPPPTALQPVKPTHNVASPRP